MDEELIRQAIEQIDPEGKISSSLVDELVISLGKKDTNIQENETPDIAKLQEKINEEKDWRKKASIAAKIISLNLEQ